MLLRLPFLNGQAHKSFFKGYQTLGFVPLGEAIPTIGKNTAQKFITATGKTVLCDMTDTRLLPFTGDLKCSNPECEEYGFIFAIQQAVRGPRNGTYAQPHLNLYSQNGILMTCDHIDAKSGGGSKHDIDNLQTMCTRCNSKKASKPFEVFLEEEKQKLKPASQREPTGIYDPGGVDARAVANLLLSLPPNTKLAVTIGGGELKRVTSVSRSAAVNTKSGGLGIAVLNLVLTM